MVCLASGSVLGLVRIVMLVWLKVWGEHVRLITLVRFPLLCHASVSGENSRGGSISFYYEVVGVCEVGVCAVLPFT
jgi:hypothetical protein